MSSQMSTTARQAVDGRRAETLGRLLLAGSDELRATGYEALTIRSVATRAGVSAATAYTYVASKNHLFAELFWRYLDHEVPQVVSGDTPVARVQAVTRQMGAALAAVPELAAAVTPALLSSDPDVERLRLRIGADFVHRFEAALGDAATPALLDALVLAFSGALLQAGMGVMTYTDMGDRLDPVVAAIVAGHA
ncbi:TetR/AcrR family transcriptional regulator [Nocardioides acrostichi]|uniref:TetR family transcriptional regulator n=1 Tax=Nocardioides acrostichi TaxID=2784339 RepID=A0A930UWP3_9ACTN|nr:TetR/AcrR family transcriptional regulator [Nocardioides acrostichi]MBF4162238.1 TetR family transcriptional regulator [Nocardioides acrostichi]